MVVRAKPFFDVNIDVDTCARQLDLLPVRIERDEPSRRRVRKAGTIGGLRGRHQLARPFEQGTTRAGR